MLRKTLRFFAEAVQYAKDKLRPNKPYIAPGKPRLVREYDPLAGDLVYIRFQGVHEARR